MTKKKATKLQVMVKPSRKKKNETKELTKLGTALRVLGGLGGGALGSLAGMPKTGGKYGTEFGALISRWLGSGDYAVSNNSLVAKGSQGIPLMHSNGQSIIVRHKEFIGDVVSGSLGTGNSTFDVQYALPLNPGLESTFPWLSTIAQQYQEYSWKGLIFHYVPTSGDSTTGTPSLGTVMMATNYRATDPAYTSKLQMLNEYFSSDSAPNNPFIHPIECDPRENPYQIQYVRNGAVPSGEDQKTYDIGVMRVATQGCPVNSVTLGELWCTYEVELKKPKPYGIDSTDSGVAHYSMSGVASAAALGSARSMVVDTIGLGFTSTTVVFPRGAYGVYLLILFNVGMSQYSQPSTLTLANCSAKTMNLAGPNSNGFEAFTSAVGLSGGPTFMTMVSITQTSLTASVTFNGGTMTGTVTGDIIVTQVSSSYA